MARAGDIEPRRGWGDFFEPFWILALCGALCGCLPSTGSGPERLYSVHDELTSIRQQVGQVQFSDYYKLPEPKRVDYRNEFIAARMYAIDVAFGAFDAALTQERQKTGFAATAANLGLTTASTLFSPPGTKSMLSAASTAVTGVKAAYNDDILLAHAVELMQGQMRTNRATISTQILKGMQLSTTEYPLAAAMSDLEAYYQAGTITGALLKLNESVGTAARNAEITRSDVILTTRFTETEATTTLNTFLFTSGPKAPVNAANRQKLIDLIVAEGNTPNKAAALLGSALVGHGPDLARRLAAAVTHGL